MYSVETGIWMYCTSLKTQAGRQSIHEERNGNDSSSSTARISKETAGANGEITGSTGSTMA